MPLNEPDCACPYPYRVQVGNPGMLGREVRYFVCCTMMKLEELTGEKFHQIMYDIMPGETPPESGSQKPFGHWEYQRRILAEKGIALDAPAA